MAHPTTGPVSSTFEIKSAQMPLMSLVLRSDDTARLIQDLTARYGDAPDFFDQDPLLVDVRALDGTADNLDLKALKKALQALNLMPVGLLGGSDRLRQAARKLGMASAEPSEPGRAPEPTPEAPRPAPAAGAEPALVVDRPLRSGQQVYARGRDLIVLAMVNAGAEVIADGHIHVYAPLRGKAMAGARGRADARIFAQSLEAELISIAGVYRTSDVPLPEPVRGRPAHVRLDSGPAGDRLLIEPLN